MDAIVGSGDDAEKYHTAQASLVQKQFRNLNCYNQ